MLECVRLGWKCIPIPIDRDQYHQWWKIPYDFSGASMRAGYYNLGEELFGPAVPRITGPTSITRTVNQAFTFTITASASPTSFNANVPPPAGLVFTPPNQITGTPTTIGVTDVTLSATNAEGTGTRNLRINIVAAPPVVITWPAYWGQLPANAIPNNETVIKTLANTLANPVVGSVMGPAQMNPGDWGPAFAYPATLPVPTSVVDSVAGNITAPFVATQLIVTMSGPNVGDPTQDYRVFFNKTAVAAPIPGTATTLTI